MASPILPDDLWERLEPLIPKPKENRHVRFAGRKPSEPRRVLTGMLFVLRTGVLWRWVPATRVFSSGQTGNHRLRQCQKQDTWQTVLEGLIVVQHATHKI